LAAEIRRRYPHAVFHASTQTSLGSLRDLDALKELGFARLVLPRELSRREIAALAEGPLECEIFLHGAHCVSCSGQCLMSYYCGGRSGNRGECAQPCRLPYRVETGGRSRGNGAKDGQTDNPKDGLKDGRTPLSLADLCLAGRIREVLGTGICSLKIEGRLKSAAYVYGVTKIYRRLLDERRDAEPEEVRELASLFGRGFTDGFFAGKYRWMGSARADGTVREKSGSAGAPEQIARDLSARLKKAAAERDTPASGTLGIRAEFSLKADEPAVLELIREEADGRKVRFRALGGVPSPAVGGELGPEGIARSLTKLGGTGFSLAPEDLRCRVESGLWMPASALNALRRAAADGLRDALDRERETADGTADNSADARPETEKKPFVPYAAPVSTAGRTEKKASAPGWTLELADARLADGADPKTLGEIFAAFERVYVPAHQYARFNKAAGPEFFAAPDGTGEKPQLCAVMPVFPLPGDGWDALCRTLGDCGCRRIKVHGIGGFRPGDEEFSRGGGWKADLSFRGNVTNAAAAKVYLDAGFETVGLSPELPAGAVRALGEAFPVSCVAYGRVPAMTTARCVLSEKNPDCRGRG
ncbi:MAG: U32 family peptidase, partial [Clostridia bacterium]|nr:U32 family peptidase [Clostridia bacterium]